MNTLRFLSLAAGGLLLSGLTALPRAAEVQAPPQGGAPSVKAEQCVEPTEVMRRNHMLYVLHQRDLTMHEGIRTETYSLEHCLSCHAEKDDEGEWISPLTKEHFCQGCHYKTAVKIDCFECHAGHPAENGDPSKHP